MGVTHADRCYCWLAPPPCAPPFPLSTQERRDDVSLVTCIKHIRQLDSDCSDEQVLRRIKPNAHTLHALSLKMFVYDDTHDYAAPYPHSLPPTFSAINA